MLVHPVNTTIANGKTQLCLQHVDLTADGNEITTAYQRKARECRMKIHEDTITKFYKMLETYTPYKMRPHLWDEQKLPDHYWDERIKPPISMTPSLCTSAY